MSSDAIERGRLPDLVTLYKILFLALVAAFVSVPLLATVLGGFKSLGELRTSPFGIPRPGNGKTTPASCSPNGTGSSSATRS